MPGLANCRPTPRTPGAGRLPLASLCLSVCLVAAAGPAVAVDPIAETSVIAPLADRSLLLDGVAVEGMRVVVGERGHVLVSDDDGVSFRQVTVPTKVTLTGVDFHDRRTGVAVGHDSVIIRTEDGGESWEVAYSAPEDETPLLDVIFLGPERVMAVGAYGLVLTSADAGRTWETRTLDSTEWGVDPDAEPEEAPDEDALWDDFEGGDDYHLNHVERMPDGTLIIAAEAGNVYRSDDGGETWLLMPSPYNGSFFGALTEPDGTLNIFGMRGNLFRSTDKGATWSPVETGTDVSLNAGRILDDGRRVLVGMSGTLLVADEGDSFTVIRREDRQGIAQILPAVPGSVILVGEAGVITVSEDAMGGSGAVN